LGRIAFSVDVSLTGGLLVSIEPPTFKTGGAKIANTSE
jgi:hypothetical protein